MEAIARGIVIPAYERLVRIKTEFEELRAKLQEAESRYNAASLPNLITLIPSSNRVS